MSHCHHAVSPSSPSPVITCDMEKATATETPAPVLGQERIEDPTRGETVTEGVKAPKKSKAHGRYKGAKSAKHCKCCSKQSKKAKRKLSSRHHRRVTHDPSSDDDDSDDDESTASASDSDDESDDEKTKRKPRGRSSKHEKRSRHRKTKRSETPSCSSSSDTDESESEDDRRRGKHRRQKARKEKSHRAKAVSSEDSSSSEDEAPAKDRGKNKSKKCSRSKVASTGDSSSSENEASTKERSKSKRQKSRKEKSERTKVASSGNSSSSEDEDASRERSKSAKSKSAKHDSSSKADKKPKKKDKASDSKPDFKRIDWVWDKEEYKYKLKDSVADEQSEYDQFVFLVKRQLDHENKFVSISLDIKSKHLKAVLAEVLKDVKSVSLVEDEPNIDPNVIFLYLDELRTFVKKTLKLRRKAAKKRKMQRKLEKQRSHAQVLLEYINHDYDETKKQLYPLLKAGNITFELLWALFKPNTLTYTDTYGSSDHPRCFKVDYAFKEKTFFQGEYYAIEGRYLDYDGKAFGLATYEGKVRAFKGPRKINTLSTYPLKYHKNATGIKKQLIERGRKFVTLEGMNFKFHEGLAFQQQRKMVAKVNINGRVMIDPAIFRRINANYPAQGTKPCDEDSDDSDSSSCSSAMSGGGYPSISSGESDSDSDSEVEETDEEERQQLRKLIKKMEDKHGPCHDYDIFNGKVTIYKPDGTTEESAIKDTDNIEPLVNGDTTAANVTQSKPRRPFTDEELLIASPVVYGFAFTEKLWLEFSVEGVRDIQWDESAFDALVLPAGQKQIVRALVESHTFHAAQTIDDVIQGKGKGLVSVLHGPPGTGKTLTAEGIAEFLRRPLYMVSAGELGADPAKVDRELQKILDIAHSWGAILLLDEADVFLERREIHDIHRNALVSVFLRLLEYFQGILFLTTNRVETFDDAIQSRIHVALRYSELDARARAEVWKTFVTKCQALEAANAASTTTTSPRATPAATPASSDTTSAISTPTKGGSSSNTDKDTTTEHFTEAHFLSLARRDLNGRQIKNVVRTAQALAVHEGSPLRLRHLQAVIDVTERFTKDLKGGTGYEDAMRSYT